MSTKGIIAVDEKWTKADGAKLLKQYGCGPIPFMGADGLYDRHLLFDNASAIAVTVPNTLPDGFYCMIVQWGAAQVTVAAGSGTNQVSRNGNKTAGTYAVATIFVLNNATYLMYGDVTT